MIIAQWVKIGGWSSAFLATAAAAMFIFPGPRRERDNWEREQNVLSIETNLLLLFGFVPLGIAWLLVDKLINHLSP
jgi:hypothetical protein